MAQRELPRLERELPHELAQPREVAPDLGLLVLVVGDVLRVLGVDEERPEHVQLHRAALAGLVLERCSSARRPARSRVRCGGRSSAIRTCVIAAYDEPTVPTRPFDQGCSAIHSTVS